MSILILLPGYNVAPHLPELISRLREAMPGADVLVVDDGSRDATAAVARAQGALVLEHGHNRGKGEALKTGFRHALDAGYEAVVTLDADLQHLPEEIPPFESKWRDEGCAVVVGSRMQDNANMPWLRKRTNEFTSWVISRLAGQTIPDSQSGFRLFTREVLSRVTLESSRYDMESEILIKAGRLGYSIGSVPVTSVYQGQHSSIHPFVDTLRFLRLVWRARRWRAG